jgi:quercetin dioxygenase-like cupin family protein
MKFNSKDKFENANMFGFGVPNQMCSEYFTGESFLNPLVTTDESSVIMANVTFEPGCRNNWHIHHAENNGGQMLICTAGEGWYQREGKKPVSLSEGSVVTIPAGVKHWHGAKEDSWFSHISVEIPGEQKRIEWFDPVSDEDYLKIKDKKSKNNFPINKTPEIYQSKQNFSKINMFGTGMYNFPLKKYFSGSSYMKMITMPGRSPLFVSNITFEPGCRNNWHIHHAEKDGGQMLICTAGEGWYQEDGKDGVSLSEGSVVTIPAGVKHWHGAKADSWFSHIAIALPGENIKNEWQEAVSDKNYQNI